MFRQLSKLQLNLSIDPQCASMRLSFESLRIEPASHIARSDFARNFPSLIQCKSLLRSKRALYTLAIVECDSASLHYLTANVKERSIRKGCNNLTIGGNEQFAFQPLKPSKKTRYALLVLAQNAEIKQFVDDRGKPFKRAAKLNLAELAKRNSLAAIVCATHFTASE
jgi:hypothetical protein